MLETPLHKLIPAMAVPTIMAMLITSIYNMADTYFVSQISTGATAAVGINMSLDQIIMMAGMFIAAGAGSYISRLLGAKNKEHADKVASTALATAFIMGMIVLVFGTIFIRPIVRFLGATPVIEQYSVDYASYLILVAPFMCMSFTLSHTLRAEGSATYSMIGMAAGGLINIALDPIFIFDYGFGLGVKGASIATAISKLISFCILAYPYMKGKTTLKPSFKKISYLRDIVVEVSKMGAPSILRTGFAIIASIILNRLAGSYSESALAAISVVNRVMFLIMSIGLGFAQGYMPVAGFCWGAKRYKRLLESFKTASIMSFCGIAILSILVFIFAEPVIGIFTQEDLELVEIGVFSLRLQAVAMPLCAWAMVVNMLYAGVGKAVGSMILGASRQGIAFFPVVAVLPRLFGIWGVAAVQAGADLLSTVVTVIMSIILVRQLKTMKDGEEIIVK